MKDNQESFSSSLNLAPVSHLRPLLALAQSFTMKMMQVVNTKNTFNSLDNVISNLTG